MEKENWTLRKREFQWKTTAYLEIVAPSDLRENVRYVWTADVQVLPDGRISTGKAVLSRMPGGDVRRARPYCPFPLETAWSVEPEDFRETCDNLARVCRGATQTIEEKISEEERVSAGNRDRASRSRGLLESLTAAAS